MQTASVVQLSVVIPCFNEADVLPLLKARLEQALEALGISWEVVFVDDGSTDCTRENLAAMHRCDPRFRVVMFSRNFGHQAAVGAGICHAQGSAVAVMDADLQDPPEILGACMEKLREGNDVVYAIRRKRKEHILKRAAYSLFYRLLRTVSEIEIPLDTGDFCVMSRKVVDVLSIMPERNIFMRGMRAWIGFKQVGLEYERNSRAAGTTKYPFKKLLRLATDGVFAFSTLPLRLATFLGLFSVFGSLLTGMAVLAWRIFGFSVLGHAAHDLPGWTAGVCCVLFLNGIQLLILGLVGEYIGRIYSEVKQRPRWVVSETLGVPAHNGSQAHPHL